MAVANAGCGNRLRVDWNAAVPGTAQRGGAKRVRCKIGHRLRDQARAGNDPGHTHVVVSRLTSFKLMSQASGFGAPGCIETAMVPKISLQGGV